MITELKPYSTYNPSGVEWLGQVPTHWKLKRPKVLFCKMTRPARASDEIVTCFRDGVVTLRKNRRLLGFTESLQEVGYQGVRQGDLVIHGMDAFAGSIGVSDADGKSTPVYSVCAPIGKHVNPYYYAYCVRDMARTGWIAALAKGIRERSTDFRFDVFGAQVIPYPTPREQTAIARFLDHTTSQIDRHIRAKQKLISLLEEQKQVMIHQAVTGQIDVRTGQPYPAYKSSGVKWLGEVPEHWDVRKIKNWLFVNCSSLPDDTHPDYSFNYLDIGSVGTGRLVSSPQRIRFRQSPSRARRIVREGDTIISTVRTYLKAVWHVCEIDFDLVASTGFAVLTPASSTCPKYVSYVCQSNLFTDQVSANSAGVAYPAISDAKFATVEVTVPPPPEQTSIANFLDSAIANIIRITDRTIHEIELLREYRTRLIADVVTGKLDVREAAANLPQMDPKTHEYGVNSILSEQHSLTTQHDNEQEARP